MEDASPENEGHRGKRLRMARRPHVDSRRMDIPWHFSKTIEEAGKPGALDTLPADEFSKSLVCMPGGDVATEIIARLFTFQWDPQRPDRLTITGIDTRLEFRRIKPRPWRARAQADKMDIDFSVAAGDPAASDGDVLPAAGSELGADWPALEDVPEDAVVVNGEVDEGDDFAYAAEHCHDPDAAEAMRGAILGAADLDAADLEAEADAEPAPPAAGENTPEWFREYLALDPRIATRKGNVFWEDDYLRREVHVGRVGCVGSEFYKATCSCRHRASDGSVASAGAGAKAPTCSLFLRYLTDPKQCENILNKWLAAGYDRDLTRKQHYGLGAEVRRAANAMWAAQAADIGGGIAAPLLAD